ncbi:MAG: NUDIX hydrolase [bacterium]|nr:NUDIX hydrolase [bacterium]
MYFNTLMIKECEAKYGKPILLHLSYPTPKGDFDFIGSTQKQGRAHDVTLYLYHENRLAVTRKPMYPKEAFRPPSGGLNPGESAEEGARREGWEELGVDLSLVRYLLRVQVDFAHNQDRICWTTHVFLTKCPGTPILNPQDRHEIVEALWANEAELSGRMRQGLIEAGTTGLLYRAHLHDVVWRQYGWGELSHSRQKVR